MDWLKQIAPTLLTALGGPLAGLAYEVVAKALGTTPQEAEDMLSSGNLNGEQLAAVRVAEIELRGKEQEIGFKFEELYVKDRDSARVREAATQDSTNKVLAYGIVLVWATLNFYILSRGLPAGSEIITSRLLGTLDAALMTVLAYYYGTTKNSTRKTELIAQAQPIKE